MQGFTNEKSGFKIKYLVSYWMLAQCFKKITFQAKFYSEISNDYQRD